MTPESTLISHPYRRFQRPCGSSPSWLKPDLLMSLWSHSVQREDISCLSWVCQTLLPSALYLVTWKDVDCIMLGLLQLMQSRRLCPLLPSQRNCGKKGGDSTLALKCNVSMYTHTGIKLSDLCMGFSPTGDPLEQHRTQGKHKNLLKERNKCWSLDPPGMTSNCFKIRCAYTAHLRHRDHLKKYTVNAKDYAGSCGCSAVHSLQELQSKENSAWAGCFLISLFRFLKG